MSRTNGGLISSSSRWVLASNSRRVAGKSCGCARVTSFSFASTPCELIGQHGLEQIEFAWKMGVERFLANAQLLGQIIHGHAAKSVTEEMRPRSVHDSLPVRIALFASRPRFVRRFHIAGSLITLETNLVYLVSTRHKSNIGLLDDSWP